MIYSVKILRLFMRPRHRGSFFTAPVIIARDGREEHWSARIEWSEKERRVGEIIRISTISHEAPVLDTGMKLTITGGRDIICEAEIIGSS